MNKRVKFKIISHPSNLLQTATPVDFEGLMSTLRLVVASLLTSGFLPSESLIAGGALTASLLCAGFTVGLLIGCLLSVALEVGELNTDAAVDGAVEVSVFVSMMSKSNIIGFIGQYFRMKGRR